MKSSQSSGLKVRMRMTLGIGTPLLTCSADVAEASGLGLISFRSQSSIKPRCLNPSDTKLICQWLPGNRKFFVKLTCLGATVKVAPTGTLAAFEDTVTSTFDDQVSAAWQLQVQLGCPLWAGAVSPKPLRFR